MKQLAIILFLVAVKTATSVAQCNEMFNYKEGTEWEWTYYDKKGKFSAKSIQKVEEYKEQGNGFVATVVLINSDKKGEQMPPQSMKMTCKDGVIYFDMKKFIPAEYTKESGGEMNVTVHGDNLELPLDMKAGDLLKDASVTIDLGSSDAPMNLKMKIDIFNRKVEGEETLTTTAGEFDCLIISQSVKTKAIVSVQVDSKDWFSPGVGMIKSESYRKGKMMGYSILTNFKN